MARTQRKERDGVLWRDGQDASSSHRAHADLCLGGAVRCRAVPASAGGDALGAEVYLPDGGIRPGRGGSRVSLSCAGSMSGPRLISVGRGASVACNEVKEDEVAKQRRAVEQEVASPPLPLASSTSGSDLPLGRCRLIHGLRRLAPKLEEANTTLVTPVRIALEEADSVVPPAFPMRPGGVIGFAFGAGHKVKSLWQCKTESVLQTMSGPKKELAGKAGESKVMTSP